MRGGPSMIVKYAGCHERRVNLLKSGGKELVAQTPSYNPKFCLVHKRLFKPACQPQCYFDLTVPETRPLNILPPGHST